MVRRSNSARPSSNCLLSDVAQRDLLSNVDYVAKPDSWLFAWDNNNPRCVIGDGTVIGSRVHGGESPGRNGPVPSIPWDKSKSWDV